MLPGRKYLFLFLVTSFWIEQLIASQGTRLVGPGSICHELFGTIGIISGQKDKRVILDHLVGTSSFQAYIRKRRISLETAKRLIVENQDFITDYTAWIYTDLMDSEKLNVLQEKELGVSLTGHGLLVPTGQARKTLETISAANVERELRAFPYQSTAEMLAVEELVASISHYFVHNSQVELMGGSLPVLSSREIEKLNGTGGLNSRSQLTKKILRSDNNVFFKILFVQSNGSDAIETKYGPVTNIINDFYAKNTGWISPFLMDENDLMDFAKARHPEVWKRIRRNLDKMAVARPGESKSTDVPDWRKYDAIYANPSKHKDIIADLEYIRSKLYELDFTVSDYVRLFKNHLLFLLNHLRLNDPVRFGEALQRLRSIEAKKDKHLAFVEDTFLPGKPVINHREPINFRFPKRFEFKIPVAVPIGELR